MTLWQNFPTALLPSASTDRQSDPAISSSANDRTTSRRLSTPDKVDYPDYSSFEISESPRADDFLIDNMELTIHQDDWMDDDYTLKELEEINKPSDEQALLKKTEETTKKTRKPRKRNEIARQPKPRACKTTSKNYNMDFSDEAEFVLQNE